MRKWFQLAAVMLASAMLGASLMLGGLALADIPDSQPSVVDPTHTLYGCHANNLTAYKEFRLLDKSQGNCPSGWREVPFAPVVPQTP